MRYNKHTLIGGLTASQNNSPRTPAHLCGLMRYIVVEDVASARASLESVGAFIVSDGREDGQFAVYVLDPKYTTIIQALKNGR